MYQFLIEDLHSRVALYVVFHNPGWRVTRVDSHLRRTYRQKEEPEDLLEKIANKDWAEAIFTIEGITPEGFGFHLKLGLMADGDLRETGLSYVTGIPAKKEGEEEEEQVLTLSPRRKKKGKKE